MTTALLVVALLVVALAGMCFAGIALVDVLVVDVTRKHAAGITNSATKCCCDTRTDSGVER